MRLTNEVLKLGLAVPRNILYQKFYRPLPISNFHYEVTRLCNSNCIYCNIWKTPNKMEDELSPSEVGALLRPRSLFKDVTNIGVTGGEPTLRKDLIEVCQALREVCPKVTFTFPPMLGIQKGYWSWSWTSSRMWMTR